MRTERSNIIKPKVSIVLGSYNRFPFLKAAIRSVRENGFREPYELIVVDGGSTDGSLRWLCRQKDILLFVQHNHGTLNGKPVPQRSWGYFMNLGFKAAQGDYLCMISDDSLLIPGAIANGVALIEQAQKESRKIGAAAFYWRNSWPYDAGYMVSRTARKIPFVNHGLYVREALEAVGWLEEDRYQFYCADVDVCLRMHQAGYEILVAEDSYVEHYFHASLSRRELISPIQKTDMDAFVTQWTRVYPELDQDCIVQDPLIKSYEDLTQTGYRFFPRLEIFKLQCQRFLASCCRRINFPAVKGK